MEIRHNEASGFPSLGLDRATRDALATYVRLRWPVGTAKAVAREFELSLDEAKGLVAARPSQTTVDKIWKHPRGGWAIAFPVMGAVIGCTADTYLQEQRKRHVENARRAGLLARDLRAGVGLSDRGGPQLALVDSNGRDDRGRRVVPGSDDRASSVGGARRGGR